MNAFFAIACFGLFLANLFHGNDYAALFSLFGSALSGAMGANRP